MKGKDLKAGVEVLQWFASINAMSLSQDTGNNIRFGKKKKQKNLKNNIFTETHCKDSFSCSGFIRTDTTP